MFRLSFLTAAGAIVCAFGPAIFIPLAPAEAANFQLLYSFTGESDGGGPRSGLITDASGNLYGTTVGGGINENGVVYKLAPDGTETVLHSFEGGDGSNPEAALIQDKAGNLISTTFQAGARGEGTIFELSPSGIETTLYAFCSQPQCADGGQPLTGVVADKAGNLYGVTSNGGDPDCQCGVVYKLAPDGTETVLHAFTHSANDGTFPSGVTLDKKGNLYGVTALGGTNSYGTLFKIAPDGTESILYSFGIDGYEPLSSLIQDKAGNFYGTTFYGGGSGVVYKYVPGGTVTVLYAFQGGPDGANPAGALTMDNEGNLYGSTTADGDMSCNDGFGCGTIFKVTPAGVGTVLYTFQGKKDGRNPTGGLLLKAQRLYGTASYDGTYDSGDVFSVKK